MEMPPKDFIPLELACKYSIIDIYAMRVTGKEPTKKERRQAFWRKTKEFLIEILAIGCFSGFFMVDSSYNMGVYINVDFTNNTKFKLWDKMV